MSAKKTNIYLELSGESTARLRGHQSVRTTFKLSERSISALSILAGQLGIKQKSLFDHLVEDVKALQAIAREVDGFPEHRQRVAKTYVISRRTLENLETVSSKFNTPRDALVEFSIERILPLIEEEKRKYARRTGIAEQLRELADRSAALFERSAVELGDDDPLARELLGVARTCVAAAERVEEYLEKGKRIEDF